MDKKTLNLRYENYDWKQFEYESIEDLKSEFNSRNISIGYRASIGNGASIGYGASIGDRASIGNDASIGYRASIGKEVKLLTGLFINGSKHSVTYSGNGMLSIGCHTHSIDEWIANADNIGIEEKYSTQQINEYKAYIQIAKAFHDNIKK